MQHIFFYRISCRINMRTCPGGISRRCRWLAGQRASLLPVRMRALHANSTSVHLYVAAHPHSLYCCM
eukprot:11116743-Alexandrium_andersonii.AAC.1